MSVHLFGVRHHGVGSARSLVAALTALQPDAILIEGPADADPLLPLAAHAAMRPPVALLLYNPEQPRQSAFYPFAVFSPEWQALQYGFRQGVAVNFMDLPQKYMLALRSSADDAESSGTTNSAALPAEALARIDPLFLLAQAAGYDDSERWWDHMVEQRGMGDDGAIFAAIQEAMTELRQVVPNHPALERIDLLREAFMRKTIRAAEKTYQRIAVVCGAWHVPALADRGGAGADTALLKGLPSVKTAITWAPWSYGRLARESGYGAGISAPGWYDHLWETPRASVPVRWLARVAALLRDADLSASTAQVIDATRLAEATAALRGRSLPGLEEVTEAALAVLCGGNAEPLELIRRKLIVPDRFGEVPAEVPTVPLQRDLQLAQKRLRLKPEIDARQIDLDLRNATDLGRSHLLHRLALLAIPWGTPQKPQAQAKGTFHELWRLAWQPELTVRVIEASIWGNTVEAAASARVIDAAQGDASLARLVELLGHVLLANLPDAAAQVIRRLSDAAALTADVTALMDALPPLVEIARYSDVRQTDAALVLGMIDGMIARVCVGLLPACVALDDDTAGEMFKRMIAVNSALGVLQQPEHTTLWHAALRQLAERDRLHGLVIGRAVNILYGAGALDDVATRLRLALTPANDADQAAAWLEGFLTGGASLLIYDDSLFASVDAWVNSLPAERFEAVLPLIRRTFSTFHAPERRKIAERVRQGERGAADEVTLDAERARKVHPILSRILGVEM